MIPFYLTDINNTTRYFLVKARPKPYNSGMVNYTLEKSDDPVKGFKNLYEIVNILRDPECGCPWDKEQMPADIIRSMQGEIYEYIDALSDGDASHTSEELGDIFLNLFLLAKIHDQNGDFKLSDTLNSACEKYIRRHPHVFANVRAETAEEVLDNWQNIKRTVEGRKEDTENFFSNVERNAPELERCLKISKKAAKAGFEWENISGVYSKIDEELEEVRQAETPDERLEELGDVLFSVVNLCRWYKVKPQDALHVANAKFIRRFNRLYASASEKGLKLEELSPAEYDTLWNQAKQD